MTANASKLRVDIQTLESLLRVGGWPCEQISDDTFRSRFRGPRASFPFFVRLDGDGYLHFAIVPFLKTSEKQEKSERLYARLLELNHQILMAKFSIDDDLDVVLSVEYPTQELDQSEFDDALDVLSYYADKHFKELSELAGEPKKP